MVLGRARQLLQRRPMDLACHRLETIRQVETTRETSQAVDRRPGQILERHDLAEDIARGGMLRSFPIYGTLQLPNDDDNDGLDPSFFTLMLSQRSHLSCRHPLPLPEQSSFSTLFLMKRLFFVGDIQVFDCPGKHLYPDEL